MSERERKPTGRTQRFTDGARRIAAPAAAVWRRLRALIPVSPLTRAWSRRVGRGWTIAIFAGIAAVLVYSVVSGGGDDRVRPEGVSERSLRSLGKLKPAERVAQLMMVPPGALEGTTAAEPGAILVTASDWPGASGGDAFIRGLSDGEGRTRPLIATQQEGGQFRTIGELPPAQSALEVGDAADPAIAEAWAKKAGKALRAAGFHLNLAPVADVAPLTSHLAFRAFGDDSSLVTQMTAAAIRGCRESGVACAPSHFPGLGAASNDPAGGPATVGLDPTSLEARDLAPFRAAIREGARAMVLSLAFYAAYDPVTPGALTPQIANDLLRDQLGFKGVAITGDLNAGAITAASGAPEAAVDAIVAGADLVQITDPKTAGPAFEAILAAAKSGLIPPERLDTAVARILELKRKLGLLGK